MSSRGEAISSPDIIRFEFDDFKNLPQSTNDFTNSNDSVDCHGYSWILRLYPGGRDDADEGMMSVCLILVGSETVNVNVWCSIIVRNAAGGIAHEDRKSKGLIETLDEEDGTDSDVYGYPNFVERGVILDEENSVLREGMLVVDVELRVGGEHFLSFYVPPNPVGRNMLKLLDDADAENSDVVLEVDDGTQFFTHHLILKVNAPILADLCEANGSNVHIPSVAPEVLGFLLRYIYGGEEPESDDPFMADWRNVCDLIDAANKFELTGLKMTLEVRLVDFDYLGVDNVVELIFFADAKTCPLLKEQAVALFAARANDITHTESFLKLIKSPYLMKEVTVALYRRGDKQPRRKDATVDKLRLELSEKGLDEDGSRDMLITRLEESIQTRNVPIDGLKGNIFV